MISFKESSISSIFLIYFELDKCGNVNVGGKRNKK